MLKLPFFKQMGDNHTGDHNLSKTLQRKYTRARTYRMKAKLLLWISMKEFGIETKPKEKKEDFCLCTLPDSFPDKLQFGSISATTQQSRFSLNNKANRGHLDGSVG